MIKSKIERWEELWSAYIDKLNRLEDLKRAGRYGFQLRQPKKAVRIALEKLREEFPEESEGL